MNRVLLTCFTNASCILSCMKEIICKIVGHREFDPGVVASRPWEGSDLHSYSELDFREENCLRCGHELDVAA